MYCPRPAHSEQVDLRRSRQTHTGAETDVVLSVKTGPSRTLSELISRKLGSTPITSGASRLEAVFGSSLVGLNRLRGVEAWDPLHVGRWRG